MPLEKDDIIRNLDELQVIERLEAYDKITKAEEWKRSNDFLNSNDFLSIQDPIARMNENIIHKDKIIEEVHSNILKRDAK